MRPPVQEDRQTRESPVSRFFSRLSLSASSLAGRERERESALRLYIVLKDVDSAFPPSLSTHPTHPIHPTRIHTYIPILNPKQPPSDNFYSYDPQRRRRGGGRRKPESATTRGKTFAILTLFTGQSRHIFGNSIFRDIKFLNLLMTYLACEHIFQYSTDCLK